MIEYHLMGCMALGESAPLLGHRDNVSSNRAYPNNDSASNSSTRIGPTEQADQSVVPSSFYNAALTYPRAVGWSLFFSLGVIMASFDPQLVGNLYATPAFQKKFGRLYHGEYIIPAAWQTALGIGSPLGQVVGTFAAWPMDRFGRKKTFAFCVVITSLCVGIQFSATSLYTLLVGELLNGIFLGSYVVIAPTYAAEVCPLELRGVLTGFTNAAFVIGQLLGNLVVSFTSRLDSQWAYRLPFAVQWVWPAIIVSLITFAPESPWWLVKRRQTEAARNSLTKLGHAGQKLDLILESIVATCEVEMQDQKSSPLYQSCFESTDLRRTEIAAGVYCTQVISGIYLVGYVTEFFQIAGLSTRNSFKVSILFLALGLLGTIISWLLLDHVGRRTLFLYGLCLLSTIQIIVGALDCPPTYASNTAFIWSQAYLMLLWNFVYGCTIGPVAFTILSEVPSTTLKAKTVAIATAAQALLGLAVTPVLPYMFSKDGLALRGKCGFVFGITAGLCWVWAYFRVPETAGRTYQELDVMFKDSIDARDFKQYNVRQTRFEVPSRAS